MKIVKLEILQSALITLNQTQGIDHQKYPTYVHCSSLSPKFSSIRSAISRFQDIAHFRIIPLTPMLKFQSATKFLIFWHIAKTVITLHSPITALFITKFGSDRINL